MSSGGNVSTLADVDAGLKVLMENADSFFLIIMGIIVFLMQIGFAFLEAGAVRYAGGVIRPMGSSIYDITQFSIDIIVILFSTKASVLSSQNP